MNNQEREDLNKIRHFKGTVSDFKTFWDEMAGSDTNAFNTPEYQGFDDVHPTRGAASSPHWEGIPMFEDFVNENRKMAGIFVMDKQKKYLHVSAEDVEQYKRGKTVYATDEDGEEYEVNIKNSSIIKESLSETVLNVKAGDLVAHDKTGERYKVIAVPSKTKIIVKNKKGEEKTLSQYYVSIVTEEINEAKTKPTDEVIKRHINMYSVADDPYEVAVEIGKKYNWTEAEIEKAEKILRKKYLK